jgi:hypothetical protein
MSKSLFVFTLFFFFLSGSLLTAQTSSEEVKSAIDAALTEYAVNIQPPSGCECNNCKITYDGAMKITKTVPREAQLIVWGKARNDYKDPFSEGKTYIEFIAECRKDEEGNVFVAMLKWRKDPCMKYEYLIE